MDLPPYDSGLGAASLTQSQIPPFRFDNVSMRVFPLQADLGRLTSFCDRYLNGVGSGLPVPPEYASFRPALPWVYLIILDYGSMAPIASNLGWIGQSEIVFSVPLEWYRKEHGRLVFQDWAFVSPFIFVNEAISMTTGREVYGWEKHLSEYAAGVSPWTKDPVSQRILMRLSALTFPHLYSGARIEPTVLLEVRQDPPPAVTQMPMDAQGPANPLFLLTRALSRFASQGATALEILNGFRVFPRDALNLEGLTGRLASLAGLASSDAAWNTITFKQFRDEVDSAEACYQALISSKMTVRRFNRFGFQNDPALALGDLSGGFEVRIHGYDTFPVIPTLGLKVAHWEERRQRLGTGQRVTAGSTANTYMSEVWAREVREGRHRCATLKPAFPFWLDVHMDYALGREICWRAHGGDWQTNDKRPAPAVRSGRKTSGGSGAAEPAKLHTPFNTTLGAGLLEALPPFLLDDVSVRVLPLAAHPQKLQRFCDSYLNISPYASYEAYGEYVYLLVWSVGQAIARDNNLGNLKFRLVTFNVPVKWYDRPAGEKDRRLLTVGLAQPFVFADSDLAVATWREVLGVPCVQARVERPPDNWLWESQSPPERNMLRLSTSAYPALNVGQSAEERTLLEICQGDVLPTEGGEFPRAWRFISEHWGGWMKNELERKISIHRRARTQAGDRLEEARDLAMSILAARDPVNLISVKQFRDAEQPDKACYQSLVRNFLHIDTISNIQEIETPMTVRLHRYPSMPIRDLLGIRLKLREMQKSPTPGKVYEGAEVEIAQPIRPFWIQFSGRTRPAEKVCWRAEGTRWNRDRKPEAPDDSGNARYFFLGAPKVGPYLTDFISGQWSKVAKKAPVEDLADPDLPEYRFADLKSGYKKYQQWFSKLSQAIGTELYFTKKQAAEIAEAVEPQVVIESLLNRHIGRWPPATGSEWTEAREFHIPVSGVGEEFRDFAFPTQHLEWKDGEDEPRAAGRHPDDDSLFIGTQLADLLRQKRQRAEATRKAPAAKAPAKKAPAKKPPAKRRQK